MSCVLGNHVQLCGPVGCSSPGSSVLGFSRQEYWSGLPFPPPGDLPDLMIEPKSPAQQMDSLPLSHLGSPSCIPQRILKKKQKDPPYFIKRKYTLANKCLFWLVVDIHESQLLIPYFEELRQIDQMIAQRRKITAHAQKYPDTIFLKVIMPMHVCVSRFSSVPLFLTHGLQPTRLFCPWDSPGKNTGGGCHVLLHGVFPTQDQTCLSCIPGRFFTIRVTWKAQKCP